MHKNSGKGKRSGRNKIMEETCQKMKNCSNCKNYKQKGHYAECKLTKQPITDNDLCERWKKGKWKQREIDSTY